MSRESRQKAQGFVSAQQVAELAGVSRSAVSRAFTPGASIAPETRDKVMEAAAALGYQVNDLARGLLANRSRLVGLVTTKPEVGFRAHLVAALSRALIRRGNIPFLINTGSSEQELKAAQTALFGYRAEATIILSGSPPASFVELARQNGQPLVMLGRSETGCDHIRIDNAEAAESAARYFSRAGFTRLGLAGSESATPSIIERERVFTETARSLGCSVMVARGRDSDYAGGQRAAMSLLSGTERPQAIFCVNDLIALGLLDFARSTAGLRIPAELSVIGFDDIPEASWDSYRLTTFRQDPEEMARQAILQMERRLENPQLPPSVVQLDAVFVTRDSAVCEPSHEYQ